MNNKELSQAYRDLNRAHRLLTATYLSTFRLYPGQPRLLFLIEEQPGITVKDMVLITGNTKESISVSIKRMASMGLIDRAINDRDKREKNLTLSEKGKALSETIHAEFDALNDMMFDGLSDQEKEVLIDLFIRMRSRLQKKKEGIAL